MPSVKEEEKVSENGTNCTSILYFVLIRTGYYIDIYCRKMCKNNFKKLIFIIATFMRKQGVHWSSAWKTRFLTFKIVSFLTDTLLAAVSKTKKLMTNKYLRMYITWPSSKDIWQIHNFIVTTKHEQIIRRTSAIWGRIWEKAFSRLNCIFAPSIYFNIFVCSVIQQQWKNRL